MLKRILSMCLLFLVFSGVLAGCESVSAEGLVYLELDKEYYHSQDESIEYTIVNKTGKNISVVVAPKLEKKTKDGWEQIMPENVGFCGTPDSISETYHFEIPLEWYEGQMKSGEYRLSVNQMNDQEYEVQKELSVDFIFQEVVLTLDDDTLSPSSAKFTIENKTDILFVYGDPFWIEKKTDDIWSKLEPLNGEMFFTAIGYMLEPFAIEEIQVSWEYAYDKLPAGEYRLVKDYMRDYGPSDEKLEMYCEFIISADQ